MSVAVTAFEMDMIDKVSMPTVITFIYEKLQDFDTSMVEWIKLLPLNKKAILHGCCAYPQRIKPRSRQYKSGYRLRASVNTELAPPFLYLHWGRIPSAKCKQGWYSGEKLFRFEDLEECAVHTLAHECFHFLSHSRQVADKNTEANANWWADQWTDEFRMSRLYV
ncbi:MAG: hypothetical protein PVG75_07315 [Thioalkalispiraceae bacterium]